MVSFPDRNENENERQEGKVSEGRSLQSPSPSWTQSSASSPWESITSYFPFASSSSSPEPPPPSSYFSYIPQDPLVVGILSALAGTGLTMVSIVGYRRYWRRIRNADYVTSGMLEKKRWVKGVVTSVGDGDNFRLFHTPGIFYSYPFKLRSIPSTPKELKDETLHIRISGVDAPELAHFGNPAQPHGQESLDWLKATILGRKVRCQLLRKDQYNRIVGVPYIRRLLLPDKPLPPLMLKEGMAVVYTSGGGEYGPWGLDGMKAVEAQAKNAKRGLWALKKFEHPADYKKRVKAAEEGMVGVRDTARKERRGLWGLVKRLLWR